MATPSAQHLRQQVQIFGLLKWIGPIGFVVLAVILPRVMGFDPLINRYLVAALLLGAVVDAGLFKWLQDRAQRRLDER